MSVVSLSSVLNHLNLTQSDNDGKVQDFIDSAEAAIVERTGPLELVQKTERVRGGGRTVLPLRVSPAASLTSVTPVDGTALNLSDLYLDKESALVTYESGAAFGFRAYDVVYMAGRATCPDDLKLAVKELVRHLWQTQRGPTARPGSSQSESTSNTIPGAAYIFPFRVEQLVSPHDQAGFA